MADQKEQAPKMLYKNLGRSGLKVSVLSFGAWINFGKEENYDNNMQLMKTAFEAGINFFDNAEEYHDGVAETLMGKMIKQLGWARKDFVVSTKIFWGGFGPNDMGLSRKHLVEGLKGSLKRLQLDYVDIVYCHRPDPQTPIEETVRAMNFLINSGKAFYWGTSEWNADTITEANLVAKELGLIGPIVEQPQYNMLCRKKVEIEFEPLYNKFGLGLTTFSPLAHGLLSGKYNDGIPPGTRFDDIYLGPGEWSDALQSDNGKDIVGKLKQLTEVAKKLGCSLSQLAILWILKNPNVTTAILGATKVSQLKENIEALKFLAKVDDQVLKTIESILKNKPPKPQSWR